MYILRHDMSVVAERNNKSSNFLLSFTLVSDDFSGFMLKDLITQIEKSYSQTNYYSLLPNPANQELAKLLLLDEDMMKRLAIIMYEYIKELKKTGELE